MWNHHSLLWMRLNMHRMFPVGLWGSFQFDSYILLLFNNKISTDRIQEVTLPLSQHSEAIVFRAIKTADPKPAGDFL